MRFVCLVLVAWCGVAGAEDADTEAARRHSTTGSQLYEADRFADAIVEFELAKKLKPLPAFDFNIARCQERLEKWGEAADSFERYLAAQPDVPEAPEIRQRIATLRARVTPPPPAAPAPSRPRRSLRAPAIALLVVAVALAATGAGLVGSVAPELSSLREQCRLRPCGPADWSGLETRAHAGYALFGVAGAVAVADVVLWALDARAAKPTQSASLGLAVSF
jgi:hypothetical protein